MRKVYKFDQHRIVQFPLGLATLGLATRNNGLLDDQYINSTLGLATYTVPAGFSNQFSSARLRSLTKPNIGLTTFQLCQVPLS